MRTLPEQLKSTVKHTIDLQLSALPELELFGVLARQIEKHSRNLTSQQRGVLADALFCGKPDVVTPAFRERTQPRSVPAQLNAFIQKYQISELGTSKVAVTLPEGTRRIDFLKEAQPLSISLHASKPGKYGEAYQAVCPEMLGVWEAKQPFTSETKKALSLKVDGNVKRSTNLTHREQVNRGWNDVALEDLAVAHTAFYLLTGKDLFEGNTVRAAHGMLTFAYISGLKFAYDAPGDADRNRYSNVSACRSLSARR